MPTKRKKATASRTKKRATRRTKRVKKQSCRAHGSVLSTAKKKSVRSRSASKLGSKTCKTKSDIKKSTAHLTKITTLAKKIRKPREKWNNAVKRAAAQLRKKK